jgi:hypothetical protein
LSDHHLRVNQVGGRRAGRDFEHPSERLARLPGLPDLDVADAERVSHFRALRRPPDELFEVGDGLSGVTEHVVRQAEHLHALPILSALAGRRAEGVREVLNRARVIALPVMSQAQKVTDLFISRPRPCRQQYFDGGINLPLF